MVGLQVLWKIVSSGLTLSPLPRVFSERNMTYSQRGCCIVYKAAAWLRIERLKRKNMNTRLLMKKFGLFLGKKSYEGKMKSVSMHNCF